MFLLINATQSGCHLFDNKRRKTNHIVNISVSQMMTNAKNISIVYSFQPLLLLYIIILLISDTGPKL